MRRPIALTLLTLFAASPLAVGCGKTPEAAVAGAATAPVDDKDEQAADKGLEIPEGARVLLLEPADGAIYVVAPGLTKAKIHVRFGIEKMEVKPAGEIIAGTGHHHLIINERSPEFGQPVPKTDTSIHYGQGQTEAEIELVPGTYDLNAQFANGAHLSYGPRLHTSVRITVEAPPPVEAGAPGGVAPTLAPGMAPPMPPGQPAAAPAGSDPPLPEAPPPAPAGADAAAAAPAEPAVAPAPAAEVAPK